MKQPTDSKLSFKKDTLKNLTVSTGIRAGRRPQTCPPNGTCVPYGSAGTSTVSGCSGM